MSFFVRAYFPLGRFQQSNLVIQTIDISDCVRAKAPPPPNNHTHFRRMDVFLNDMKEGTLGASYAPTMLVLSLQKGKFSGCPVKVLFAGESRSRIWQETVKTINP